jgi:hypothetical protein
LANQLNFGSGTVYGPVATGPGGTIPASLIVGSHAWLAANPGVDYLPWITSDMNVTLPNVPAPYGSGLPPSGSIVGGVLYTYVLTSGNWYMPIGNFGGNVLVTGNATLYVPSTATVNFSPTTGSITIATNASLKLYVGSPSAVLPNLVNSSGNAAKFTYFGLPTNTDIKQTVNADFVGTVYAPSAKYTLGGNGTGSEQKIIGAIVSASMYYNDFFTFHYDLNLARIGLSNGYLMASWDEL